MHERLNVASAAGDLAASLEMQRRFIRGDIKLKRMQRVQSVKICKKDRILPTTYS